RHTQSMSKYGHVRIVDATTLKPLVTLKPPAAPKSDRRFIIGDLLVSSFAFSRDGKRILAGLHNGSLVMFDVASGKPIDSLSYRAGSGGNSATVPISQVCWSDDGSMAVAMKLGRRAFIDIWDVKNKKLRYSRRTEAGLFKAAKILADNRTVLLSVMPTYQKQEYLIRWDAGPNEDLEKTQPERRSGSVSQKFSVAAFSNDAKQLAIVIGPRINVANVHTLRGAALQLIDQATGKPRMIASDMLPVFAVTFSPDGRHVAAAGVDGVIRRWDVSTGKQIACPSSSAGEERNTAQVHAVAASPNGSIVVSGDADGRILVRQSASGKVITALNHGGPVRALAFSDDGRKLGSYGMDMTLRIWNTASWRQMSYLTNPSRYSPSGGYYSMAWSADSKFVAVALGGGMICWETMTESIVKVYSEAVCSELAKRLRFNPGGKGTLHSVGPLCEGAGVPKNSQKLQGNGIQIHSNRKHAAYALGNKVMVMDMMTRKPVRELLSEASMGAPREIKQIRQVAYSPDEKLVVAIQDNVATGYRGYSELAVIDQMIRVWDAASGSELLSLKGHRGQINAISFTAGGRVLLTGGADGTVIAWDLTRRGLSVSSDKAPSGKGPGGEGMFSGNEYQATMAMRVLADKPKTALGVVLEYLRGDAGASETADPLIAKLSSDKFSDRVAATIKLADLITRDPSCEKALVRKLLGSNDLGSKTIARIRSLLTEIKPFPRTRGYTELQRIKTLLEWTGGKEAKYILVRMGDRLPEMRLGSESLSAVQRIDSGRNRDKMPAAPVKNDASGAGSIVAKTPSSLNWPPAVTVSARPPIVEPEAAGSVKFVNDVITDKAQLPKGAVVQFGGGAMTHRGPITSVEISPNGKHVVSAGTDGKVRIWDIATGRMIRQFPGGDQCPLAKFASSGDMLVVADASKARGLPGRLGKMVIYDLKNGKVVSEFDPPVISGNTSYDKLLRSIAISPNGKILAAVWGGGIITFTGLPDGKSRGYVVLETSKITVDIAFSPDSTRLVSLMNDWTTSRNKSILALWDVVNLQRLDLINESGKGSSSRNILPRMRTATFSADGKAISLLRSDGQIQRYAISDKGFGTPAKLNKTADMRQSTTVCKWRRKNVACGGRRKSVA
ncbi:MAG: hypothetical protein HN350_21275, partial [Phycisphaerales bacterium]|nr:hypothetical protein [Phycisphaerales bacterium]